MIFHAPNSDMQYLALQIELRNQPKESRNQPEEPRNQPEEPLNNRINRETNRKSRKTKPGALSSASPGRFTGKRETCVTRKHSGAF